jgi:cytidine deaminase
MGQTRVKSEELLAAALSASRQAHAPYSGYRVGAAIETAAGAVFRGCNVENASYGLTLCAERAAVAAAVAAGHRQFRRIAIAASGRVPPYPCGACRQVLAEFAGPELEILVAQGRTGALLERTTLGALLPRVFARPAPAGTARKGRKSRIG